MTVYIVNDLSYAASRLAGEITFGLEGLGHTITPSNYPWGESQTLGEDNDIVIYVHNTGNSNSWMPLRSILERVSGRRIIVVANLYDEQELRLAIALGAYGYLAKLTDLNELVQALTVVQSGGFYLSHRKATDFNYDTAVSTRIENADALVNRQVIATLKQWGVTPRQRDVAEKLLRGLTNKEIAEELKIEVGTVKVHLRALYKRFNISSRYQFFKMMKTNDSPMRQAYCV